MKATADRQALADTLTWVARAIPKRPTYPGANGMRVVAEDGMLQFSASDFETSHTARLAANVVDDGECFVPGGFLREVVAAMRGNDVDLVLDDRRLTVTSGRSSYGVQVINGEDVPRLPEFPAEVGSLTADDLASLVGSVVFAASNDEAIEGIMGVRLEVDTDQLLAIATDRYVLGTAATPWSGESFTARPPAKSLQAAVAGLAGDVTVGHDDGLVGFRDTDRTVTLRCYASEFPRWRQLTRAADQDHVSVTVDAAAFAAALKLAAAVLDDKTPIAVDVADGSLELSTDSEAGGGSEVIEATVEPADTVTRIHLSPRRILAALGAAGAPEVVLGLGADPMKPVCVRPVGHDHTSHLVMPSRV